MIERKQSEGFQISRRGDNQGHKQMSVFQGELKVLYQEFCSTGVTPRSLKTVKAQFSRLMEMMEQKPGT